MQIDRYRVVKKLGEGGFGCVYLGIDEKSNHQAAIKLLDFPFHTGSVSVQDPQLEAFCANAVRHPNVVAVLSWGIDSRVGRYLVSDYVDGESLADRVQRLGLAWPLSDVLQVGHQIAAVMAILHARNVVHRDLTLRNILLQPDAAVPGGQRVRVLDFGLSQLGPAGSAVVAGAPPDSSAVPGTGPYLAPEVVLAGFSKASDVYSLGTVLKLLFEGYVLPANLTALCAQMTCSDPRARPTMAEVADLLLRAWRKQRRGSGSRTVLLAGSVFGGMLAGFVALGFVQHSTEPAPVGPPAATGPKVAALPGGAPVLPPAPTPTSTATLFPLPPAGEPSATPAPKKRLRRLPAPKLPAAATSLRQNDDVGLSPGGLLRTLPPKHLALPFSDGSATPSNEH